MAIEIIWDQIQDAAFEQALASGERLVRTALVKGVDSTATGYTARNALLKIPTETGVPQMFDLHPDYNAAFVTGRICRGIPRSNLARLWIHYERPGGGNPIERFAAEDNTSLVSEPTDVFPGQTKQLRCSLTSTSPNYETDNPPATDRPIRSNYPRNMRSLVLFGLFADRPPLTVLKAIRTVNHANWQGLPRGYWLCEGPRVRYSSRDGMFSVTVGFLSRGDGTTANDNDDWSTYEVPYRADGTQAGVKSSILATLYAQPYTYGVVNDKNGIWKGGFYKTANFSTIFGDTFPIGD